MAGHSCESAIPSQIAALVSQARLAGSNSKTASHPDSASKVAICRCLASTSLLRLIEGGEGAASDGSLGLPTAEIGSDSSFIAPSHRRTFGFHRARNVPPTLNN